VPVVFTLYFNNDDSGTNAGPGTSRISLVGAGGTPEGTTRRRALLSQASAARGEEFTEAAGAHGRSLLQPRSAFTANLIFNHDLFNCAIESNCAVTSSSATSNVYSCDQQITTLCGPRRASAPPRAPLSSHSTALQPLQERNPCKLLFCAVRFELRFEL